MALKATIYKVTVNVSDMDRHYYDELSVTVAQHPSESNQRMMVRLIAFIINANEQLEFTKGLSEDSEPEIWQKSYSDEIELWIELGLPDEKRLKQAAHKSKQLIVYSYGDNAAEIWWKQNKSKLCQLDNLAIYHISDQSVEQLAGEVQRSMQLQVTIQDSELWLSSDTNTYQVTINKVK